MKNGNPNLYCGPDGFSVEVLGRTGLRYRESGRSYFVDAEVLAPPGGIVVYRRSVVQEETLDAPVPAPKQVQERILSNILAMLASRGVPVDLV